MNLEIVNRVTGETIVEAGKYSSLKEAVENSGADLCYADLHGANLCGADLRGADLCYADLHGANLCGANLYDANLRGADLCYADLHGANLYDANLCGANLCGANLIIFQAGGYTAYIMPGKTSIGCEYHPNGDWLKWTPEDVKHMADDASDWWGKYKPVIVAAIKAVDECIATTAAHCPHLAEVRTLLAKGD